MSGFDSVVLAISRRVFFIGSTLLSYCRCRRQMETVHEGVNSSPSQKASKAGLILKIGSQVSCIMFSRQYNIFHPEVIKPLGVHRKHLVRPSVQNSCPVHIFFREKQWKFLLHRDVDYDLWVCHVLDPRYFGQCQGHWRKK